MSDTQPFLFTKIVATVGPATNTSATLLRLIEEGARVFRINFSHGSPADFERSLAAIREAEKLAGFPIGVLGDLSGPKIRVGKVAGEGVQLNVGDEVLFQHGTLVTTQPKPGEPVVFCATLPNVIDDVEPGQRLLIDDGNVRVLITEKVGSGPQRTLRGSVTVGGKVTSSKGVNLPDSDLKVPSITEHDWRCVDWALAHEIDFLALSFVRQAADLHELRAYLKKHTPAGRGMMPIIAKIEKPQALTDLEQVVVASDLLMVARGDLGVEMDLAEVPVIQKRIIALAHDHGKPVIVATQMLQSMIESVTPTRAEVSDVANAIFDGADAVMLSGETAVGKYPVQVVNTMARIALATQRHIGQERSRLRTAPAKLRQSQYRTAALAHGVANIVQDLSARCIAVWSQQGGGARYLSQNRPTIPIFAVSSDPLALRRMTPMYAVQPALMATPPEHLEAFVDAVDLMLRQRQWVQSGDAIVIVAGEPLGAAGVTNNVRVHFSGDVCRVN
jgi:pyruvate kinase